MSDLNHFGPFFKESEFKLEDAPEEYKQNTFLLVKLALNQIRKKFGKTIITSGYRSPEYNESLRARGYNPSKTSQHLTGSAVDFVCPNANMREVFEYVRGFWPGQVIYYSGKGHCHIGLPTLKLAREGRLYQWIKDE